MSVNRNSVMWRGEDPTRAIVRPGGWFVGSREPEIILPGFAYSIVSGLSGGRYGARRGGAGNLSGGPVNIADFSVDAAGTLARVICKANAAGFGIVGVTITFAAGTFSLPWVPGSSNYQASAPDSATLRNLFQANLNKALGFSAAAMP